MLKKGKTQNSGNQPGAGADRHLWPQSGTGVHEAHTRQRRGGSEAASTQRCTGEVY